MPYLQENEQACVNKCGGQCLHVFDGLVGRTVVME